LSLLILRLNNTFLHEGIHNFLARTLGVSRFLEDVISEEVVHLQKLGELLSVGVTHTGDLDTFQHTVTSELVEHNLVLEVISSLVVVRNDTTDEVRMSPLEGLQQIIELSSVLVGNGDEGSTLVSTTESEICEEIGEDLVLGSTDNIFKIVLKRVHVLGEPVSGIIGHITGIVLQGKFQVSTELVVYILGVVLVHFTQLASESNIIEGTSSIVFVEDDENTLGSGTNQINSGTAVHTEVLDLPHDTFTLVFSLFKFEHVHVEKLLQTLIGKVNAELFKAVVLENFETGNIQNTDELVSWLHTERLIDLVYNPQESTTVEGLDKGITRRLSLRLGEISLNSLSLLASLSGTSDDVRVEKSVNKSTALNSEEKADSVSDDLSVVNLG
jgi:hypothetical protein